MQLNHISSYSLVEFTKSFLITECGFAKEVAEITCQYTGEERWKKVEVIKKGLWDKLISCNCSSPIFTHESPPIITAFKVADLSSVIFFIQNGYKPQLTSLQFKSLIKNQKFQFLHFIFSQMKFYKTLEELDCNFLWDAVHEIGNPFLGLALDIYLTHHDNNLGGEAELCLHKITNLLLQATTPRDEVAIRLLKEIKVKSNCHCPSILVCEKIDKEDGVDYKHVDYSLFVKERNSYVKLNQPLLPYNYNSNISENPLIFGQSHLDPHSLWK
jgi:hypothetical protein